VSVAARALLALVLLATLAVTRTATATDDRRFRYYTYETAHFRVHFPHPLDPIARRVALLSEAVHERLVPAMGFAPDAKTEVLLTDDTDSANGSATPIPYNAIRLYVTSPSDISALGDYDDWYLALVTHEYTHTLHTGNISGLAAVGNAIFGRSFSVNSVQPRWVIEGLATVLESGQTSGGRVRSSLADAFLRMDVLDGRLARLDEMSANAQRWPYGNLFYLHGSRFVQWISEVYGHDTFSAVSSDYGSSPLPFGIHRAIRRHTGRTYEELYEAWAEHLRMHYGAQRRAVEALGLREGVRLTFRGQGTAYPRFVPHAERVRAGAEELVYFRSDFHERTGLYRLELGDVTQAGPREERIFIRTNTEAYPAFAPDGEVLFSQLAPFQNLWQRHDLYAIPRGLDATWGDELHRRRLTRGERAEEPDVSPDGRWLTYTINARGTRHLALVPRDGDGRLGERRILVRSRAFDQIYTPRFSPDGRRIVYSSWSAGGFRDLRVVDVATGEVTELTHDRSMDLQPAWSPDGRSLYFSSDRTGIFNVYVRELATGRERLVTNVLGAALAPAISADGKTLAYVGYTSNGYDLYAMSLDEARYLPAPAPPNDRPSPPPEPPSIVLEKHPYDPLPTFGPRQYTIDVGPGIYGGTAFTLATSASDIAQRHVATLSLSLEADAPEPRFSIDYAYGGLPFNVGIGLTRTTVPRTTGYRVSGVDVPYDDTTTSFGSYVQVPILSPYVSQSLSLGYSANLSTPRIPPVDVRDPFEPTGRRPAERLVSQLRATYSLSTTEGSVFAPGPVRGVSMRLGVTYADEAIGSDGSLYVFDGTGSAYLPMPWPGHQVLALRVAGAVSAGTYAQRSVYFVGGYDFEQNDIVDVLFGGAYDGSFLLRGYLPGSYAGRAYLLGSAEYRAPLWVPNWGPSTLPFFLRRIDLAPFVDYGGAFDELDLERTRFFYAGKLAYQPALHASTGLEAWFGITLAHRLDTNIRLGWAYGFDDGAVPGGQLYVIASGAY
jgi:Tol biopolymer transport system component